MSLEIDGVSVRFGHTTAVEPTRAVFKPSVFVALVGPNGAGKSSLLKAMAGAVAHEGNVSWRGKRFAPRPSRTRARAIAYLPQSPASHWPMKVSELVALGRLPHRRFNEAPGTEDRDAVAMALAQTQTEALAARPVNQLSGGEHARVQLARALSVGAPILLVDEPIAMLDPYHQLLIMSVLEKQAQSGAVVVAVLHDLSLAARFCGRCMLMHEGRIVADGAPDTVLTRGSLVEYYGVEPVVHIHADARFVIPWKRADEDGAVGPANGQ